MGRSFLVVLALLLAAAASGAAAQFRTIPADAKRGVLRHVQDMRVELDGKPAELSAGGQIRDTENRIVLPLSLTEKTVVRYLTDASGKLHRVWILSKEEAAASAPKPAPKPAAKK
jgi:hypothetical protein